MARKNRIGKKKPVVSKKKIKNQSTKQLLATKLRKLSARVAKSANKTTKKKR